MSPVTSRVVITGVLLLFTLVSGIWLSNSGKPINGAVFNVHKLIALAMVVFMGVTVHHLTRGTDLRATALTAIVATGLLLVSLFVSGALLRTGKLAYPTLLGTHQVMAMLVSVCAAVTTYLLAGRRS